MNDGREQYDGRKQRRRNPSRDFEPHPDSRNKLGAPDHAYNQSNKREDISHVGHPNNFDDIRGRDYQDESDLKWNTVGPHPTREQSFPERSPKNQDKHEFPDESLRPRPRSKKKKKKKERYYEEKRRSNERREPSPKFREYDERRERVESTRHNDRQFEDRYRHSPDRKEFKREEKRRGRSDNMERERPREDDRRSRQNRQYDYSGKRREEPRFPDEPRRRDNDDRRYQDELPTHRDEPRKKSYREPEEFGHREDGSHNDRRRKGERQHSELRRHSSPHSERQRNSSPGSPFGVPPQHAKSGKYDRSEHGFSPPKKNAPRIPEATVATILNQPPVVPNADFPFQRDREPREPVVQIPKDGDEEDAKMDEVITPQPSHQRDPGSDSYSNPYRRQEPYQKGDPTKNRHGRRRASPSPPQKQRVSRVPLDSPRKPGSSSSQQKRRSESGTAPSPRFAAPPRPAAAKAKMEAAVDDGDSSLVKAKMEAAADDDDSSSVQLPAARSMGGSPSPSPEVRGKDSQKFAPPRPKKRKDGPPPPGSPPDDMQEDRRKQKRRAHPEGNHPREKKRRHPEDNPHENANSRRDRTPDGPPMQKKDARNPRQQGRSHRQEPMEGRRDHPTERPMTRDRPPRKEQRERHSGDPGRREPSHSPDRRSRPDRPPRRRSPPRDREMDLGRRPFRQDFEGDAGRYPRKKRPFREEFEDDDRRPKPRNQRRAPLGRRQSPSTSPQQSRPPKQFPNSPPQRFRSPPHPHQRSNGRRQRSPAPHRDRRSPPSERNGPGAPYRDRRTPPPDRNDPGADPPISRRQPSSSRRTPPPDRKQAPMPGPSRKQDSPSPISKEVVPRPSRGRGRGRGRGKLRARGRGRGAKRVPVSRPAVPETPTIEPNPDPEVVMPKRDFELNEECYYIGSTSSVDAPRCRLDRQISEDQWDIYLFRQRVYKTVHKDDIISRPVYNRLFNLLKTGMAKGSEKADISIDTIASWVPGMTGERVKKCLDNGLAMITWDWEYRKKKGLITFPRSTTRADFAMNNAITLLTYKAIVNHYGDKIQAKDPCFGEVFYSSFEVDDKRVGNKHLQAILEDPRFIYSPAKLQHVFRSLHGIFVSWCAKELEKESRRLILGTLDARLRILKGSEEDLKKLFMPKPTVPFCSWEAMFEDEKLADEALEDMRSLEVDLKVSRKKRSLNVIIDDNDEKLECWKRLKRHKAVHVRETHWVQAAGICSEECERCFETATFLYSYDATQRSSKNWFLFCKHEDLQCASTCGKCHSLIRPAEGECLMNPWSDPPDLVHTQSREQESISKRFGLFAKLPAQRYSIGQLVDRLLEIGFNNAELTTRGVMFHHEEFLVEIYENEQHCSDENFRAVQMIEDVWETMMTKHSEFESSRSQRKENRKFLSIREEAASLRADCLYLQVKDSSLRFQRMHKRVYLKGFDFNRTSETLLRHILQYSYKFLQDVGSELHLEIPRGLSYIYLSSEKRLGLAEDFPGLLSACEKKMDMYAKKLFL